MRFAVIRSGDEWNVLSERRRIGHFADAEAAMKVALQLANEARLAGHTVEYLVQDANGELRPVPGFPSSPPPMPEPPVPETPAEGERAP